MYGETLHFPSKICRLIIQGWFEHLSKWQTAEDGSTWRVAEKEEDKDQYGDIWRSQGKMITNKSHDYLLKDLAMLVQSNPEKTGLAMLVIDA